MIAKLPLKIVLFPIRKVLAVVTSVRGVPLEVIRTVLLARTLDRQLTSAGENIDTRRAAQMRVAFDETFAGTDFRVVRAAIGDALRGVRGLKSAASDMAARLATKQGRQAEEEIGSAKDQRVDAGATRVEQALASAEIMELFAEFDRRFDKALANVGQRPSAS